MPISNKGSFTVAASSFETRVSQGAKEHTGMEGKNSGGYETRVTQESGTH